MRSGALVLAGLLAMVPVAEAKQKRPERGWRPKPPRLKVVVLDHQLPHEAAPVESAGALAERLAPAAPPPPPPPPPAPACDPSPWLGAIAEDVGGFRLRLTRTCVPAGTVLFQFRNLDLATHNLWAEGVTPAAAPRQIVGATDGETTVQASAQLAAGTWRLYCSFEGHEAMSRLVAVTATSR